MSQTKVKDFLAILLTAEDDNGIGMTPLEIRNEVDTFLFEGSIVNWCDSVPILWNTLMKFIN